MNHGQSDQIRLRSATAQREALDRFAGQVSHDLLNPLTAVILSTELLSKKPVVGGATRFEQLSATLRLTPDGVRFNPLAVNSGLMQAIGRLDVDRQSRLAGAMDIEMKGISRLRVPVSFAGTLRSPEIDLR